MRSNQHELMPAHAPQGSWQSAFVRLCACALVRACVRAYGVRARMRSHSARLAFNTAGTEERLADLGVRVRVLVRVRVGGWVWACVCVGGGGAIS